MWAGFSEARQVLPPSGCSTAKGFSIMTSAPSSKVSAIAAGLKRHWPRVVETYGSLDPRSLLCAWTPSLPMGRRFSLDAVRAALAATHERSADQLNARPAKNHRAAVSLAVLAILLELSVIYYFNAVNKHGWTWRRGLAVY